MLVMVGRWRGPLRDERGCQTVFPPTTGKAIFTGENNRMSVREMLCG